MRTYFRGVAYINTDVCMSGPILEPVASPTLMDILVPATKDIFSPEDETKNYYDWWKTWSGEGDNFDPEVSPFVGSGSDHASFIFYAGIPVLDIMFQEDRKRYPDIGGYPAYHTGFETFEQVDKVYDANFTIFGACAQLNLRIGLELAETELLPLKMEPYATVMENGAKVLNETGILQKLTDLQIDTSFFIEAIQEFRSAAEGFDHLTSNSLSELEIRVLNDQMRGFEKTFLLYEGEYYSDSQHLVTKTIPICHSGLPDRIQYRHVITAPSLFDAYGGAAFPGLGDLLYKLEQIPVREVSEDYTRVVKQIKKHVSDIMIIIKRASHFLRPIKIYHTTANSGVIFQSNLFFSTLIIILTAYFVN